jgi:hypothetical protein
VQVWSATTENVWLRLLLPKEGQPVNKSKGSHTFSTLHCECLHGVLKKDMKKYKCLCVISLNRLCLSIVVTQILWPIYAEIKVIPKGSHTLSWPCMLQICKTYDMLRILARWLTLASWLTLARLGVRAIGRVS